MGLNLLEKTELWVNEITLENANLTDMAHAVAGVLGLPENEVLVVDVRPRHITFDVLAKEVPQENIMGKEEAILEALGKIPGVHLTPESYLHSNGILGLICAGVEHPEAVLDRVAGMTSEIQSRIARRAIVFPTGFELKQGLIEDTNTPYLKGLLEERGYTVTVGEIMEDDLADICDKLDDALSRGFGLILTTGGVGAEDKDHSVEAICRMDPTAATPYIVKFQQGTGRHVKDGVRIGVGREGPSLMVSLPGPHDEVECAAPVLLRGLEEGWSKEVLADRLAAVLADKWRQKGLGHGHHHG
ncbi:MAG TPA: competence/damage-inducible protein A [Candidatus Galloscillospira excrementavium]|nr:competence/damage-inducible protein A [Candidatus Galloscillospira excrementavium]